MPMPPEHRAFLQKHLEPYSRDNHVWDFCCGIGHNGIISLKHNARWVTFTDVREAPFKQWMDNKPKGEITNTNYCWKYFDADQIDKYLPEIPTQDLDVIIYCGHLYHARNHYEIAKMFTQTSARHLILESKTKMPNIIKDTVDQEMKMTIDWHVEGTQQWCDTYEENLLGPEKKLHSLVGAPNFIWTITCFEMLGWTAQDSEIVDMVKRHPDTQFNTVSKQKVHDSLYQYRIKFVRNV